MNQLFIIFYTLLCINHQLSWTTNLDKAKLEAAQSSKLILLNFSGSDWCIPCKKLELEVFETEYFKEYAEENLILVKADFPRQKKNQLSSTVIKANEKLASKYNEEGTFPLTLLLDASGREKLRLEGLPKGTVESFVDKLDRVVHPQ